MVRRAAGGDDDVPDRSLAERRGDRLDGVGLSRRGSGPRPSGCSRISSRRVIASRAPARRSVRPRDRHRQPAREPDLAGKRARQRLERVAAGSNTCRWRDARRVVGRRPTASAARPRRSGRRSRRSRGRGRPGAGWRCASIVPTTTASNELGARPRARRSRHRSGDPATTTSSTEANRVRSARPEPGATIDDVSAGVRSAGSGMIARIRVVGARAIGAGSPPSGARSVRVSARSASSREMARCSAEPTTSRSGCGSAPREPAAERGETRARGGQVGRRRTGHGPRRRPSVASIRRRDGGSAVVSSRSSPARIAAIDLDRLGGALGERAHVERVADRHAARSRGRRAAMPSMTAGERVAGSVGSPVSAGTATWADIASPGPGRDRRPERHELRRPRVVARSPGPHPARDGVSGSTAPRPGKCLTEAATPAACEPADHRRAEPPDRPPDRRRTSGSPGSRCRARSRGRGPARRPR